MLRGRLLGTPVSLAPGLRSLPAPSLRLQRPGGTESPESSAQRSRRPRGEAGGRGAGPGLT